MTSSSDSRRIRVLVGDLFVSDAHTIVNAVNCVGVMGKGIALEFRKRFPEMYEDYVARCRQKRVRPGAPNLFRRTNGPQIVNFPTKDHWRSASKIEDVERGLAALASQAEDWGVRSIAIPALGCGNGQLAWADVGPLIYRSVSGFDFPVELYAPAGTPPHQLAVEFLQREP